MPRPGEPDYYRSRARAEGYVARAVYKLKEVDEKYHLIKPGQRVLDLGCSPGSWLQYIASRTGPGGLVVGVDATLPAIEIVPPLYFVRGEVTSIDLEAIIAISPTFDVVLSDLAPKTTGMRAVDQQRSLELASLAWEWARRLLKEGGHFLVKIFEGPDTSGLAAVLKQNFSLCRPIKPAGSRPASREIYLLGLKKRSVPSGSPAPQSGPRQP
jgi:23S rRNA (uridine2552-2'-O)-methyltransferase